MVCLSPVVFVSSQQRKSQWPFTAGFATWWADIGTGSLCLGAWSGILSSLLSRGSSHSRPALACHPCEWGWCFGDVPAFPTGLGVVFWLSGRWLSLVKVSVSGSLQFNSGNCFPLILFFLRFYLFIFREGKGERKKVRETSMCGCL